MSGDKLLGEAIRRFRMGAGMTAVDVAERCGVGNRYVSDIERGSSVPSLPFLRALASLPDVPAELRQRFERAVLYPETNGTK